MRAIERIARVMGERYDLEVVFKGGTAYTDGRTIVLPALPEGLGERGLTLARGYSDHEVGHIRHTDFDAVRRAFKGPEDRPVQAMWNCIEDLAMERRHGIDFHGARVNMEALANDVLEEADRGHPLMWLFIEGRRRVCGYDLKGPSYDRAVRRIWGDDVYERIAALRDTGEAIGLAREMVGAYEKRREESMAELPEDGGGDESGEEGPCGDGLPEDGGGAELKAGAGLPEIDAAEDPFERVRERLERFHAEAAQRGDYLVYDRSLDSLDPMEEAADTAEYERLKSSLGTLNAMRGRVRGLFLARTASRWMNGRERGRLDPRALARIEAGCRSVFREKTASRERETAVSLLIDFSASMGGHHRGRPLEQAMRAAVFLLECLEGSGMASEVLTFTTGPPIWTLPGRESGFMADPNRWRYGRVEPLLMKIVKAFSERLGRRVKGRISNWRAQEYANNCDGDSVLAAFERLAVRREPRKVLFVLSDGMVSNRGNREAGRAHLKRVCKEVAGRVELICLALSAPDAREYYPKAIDLKRASDLPFFLYREVRRIFAV